MLSEDYESGDVGMPMSQLRMVIREVIDRHIGRDSKFVQAQAVSADTGLSFTRFHLNSGGDEAPCLIEPSVQCTQCGYCISYGH